MPALENLSLFSYLLKNPELKALEDSKTVHVSSPEALALLAALSFQESPRKMAFLFPTLEEAENFSQFLGDYLKENEVYFFPFDDIYRTSAIGASPEMTEERLLAISSVFDFKPSILIAHMSSLALSLMPKERYQKNLFTFKKGDMLLLKKALSLLSRLGYTSVDRVSAANQFALRGGILDIYDASYPHPVRLEFFGDEIDDIRFFQVNDELSFEHVRSFLLHPASLRLLEPDEAKRGCERIDKELEALSQGKAERLSLDDLKERMETLKNEASSLFLPDIDQRFYPLFISKESCLKDYLSDYQSYLYDFPSSETSLHNVIDSETEYFDKNIKSNSSLKEEKVYVSKPLSLKTFLQVSVDGASSFVIRNNSYRAVSYATSDQLLKRYNEEGYKVRIILPEPNYTNYIHYLSDASLSYSQFPTHSQLMIVEGRITHGFELPKEKHAYLSAKEIYGVTDQRSRFLSRYKEAKIIRKYEDLQVGDYVVHEVHGVGKYLGVITMDGLEYLKIQYAEDALFYLPLSQYRLIRKYSSREGYAPTLDRLGGSTWARKKARIRSKISYLADQLLALYSERKTKPGYSFPQEPELENQFMSTFPYPYTRSQKQVIDEVKKDMESGYPMDRLIAGDVGFGKTEIAFNAAFKAILAHKQVAFLCPTTILAMQHLKVALERFEGFGVRICAFSRFVPKNVQDKNIALIKEGKIDLIIGTHRLLSDDIVFKDLGLLIVDEEQKFGVAHKEKIKEKVKNVDCLTLTATPIPRTMQMSLLSVRSLSLLEEPPINRMPVKTYVAKMDKELILEVIRRELARKGQVYYLHNDIASIHNTEASLKKAFPDAHIEVVHARMADEEIEDRMSHFYAGDIDVLVCTSIIESGLDIPNVNTIIVENADRFGLSQLYQIKGRVGRSDRLAYAYFFFREYGKITDDAKKRLKALKDFTELGSGYKIAMQDLNIRGTGDILGAEQAGFVDSLGYDAYMELLTTVVKEKQVMAKAMAPLPKDPHVFELSFSLDAHIPSDYGSEPQRISMYRELSDCASEKDIALFATKLRDVYGPYPEEVANLLLKRRVELELNSSLYDSFVEGLGVYTIVMSEEFSNRSQIYKTLESTLAPLLERMRVLVTGHRFEFILTKTKDYLSDLLFLTGEIRKAWEK